MNMIIGKNPLRRTQYKVLIVPMMSILLFATPDENPEQQLESKELKSEIKVALGTLNQREALIAQLYYVEELNIYEISEILDISTGRISQIKKKLSKN